MKNTVNMNSINLVNADSLSFIKTLPDDCIDLIATDPPYYRVKACKWDNQWESEGAYLAWLDELLVEFRGLPLPSPSDAGTVSATAGQRSQNTAADR